jgi:hypothetical protein
MAARISSLVLALLFLGLSAEVQGACRKIDNAGSPTIDKKALADIGQIGLGRDDVFAAIKDVSVPEAKGCWSSAAGDFDGQIISVGVMQWNLGQGSLQPLLRKFKTGAPSSQGHERLQDLMPSYGKLLFSAGCLRTTVTKECHDGLLKLQTNGVLDAKFKGEVDAVFETDLMVQIEVDYFVRTLGSVKSDLARIFPGQRPSPREIKWAIDTKVQQGAFPADADIARLKAQWDKLAEPAQRTDALLSLMDWYRGLCNSVDQGGVDKDCAFNFSQWHDLIAKRGVSGEQGYLLYLTFLRSRTAASMSGYWQALTFQRRAKIVLGVGSVGGNRVSDQSVSEVH